MQELESTDVEQLDWLDMDTTLPPEEVVDVTPEEAELYGRKIIDYFDEFGDVTDYYMSKKLEKLEKIHETFSGYGQCDELFDGHSVQPKDMDIEIVPVESDAQNSLWNSLTQITATFPIENMPGRAMKLLIRDNTSGTYLGMLRLGTPVLNMKPRNDSLGEYVDAEIINPTVFNGTVIVPAQPFGFNMLGGKLMALICASNEVRALFKERYKADMVLFETTSLYGSIKGGSQYDGLKPFIRYGGDTDSKFPMNLGDELHHEILRFFVSKNPNFVDFTSGSIKFKSYMKILGTIKRTLKESNHPFYQEFVDGLQRANDLNTNKRYYYSDYGVANILEHMKGAKPVYKEGMSKKRFDLENLVNWWKKKAQKRYESVVKSDRLKENLEYWTPQRVKEKYIEPIR